MPTLALAVLAQHPSDEAVSRLIPWIAGLIGFICLGAILIGIIRRVMRGSPESSADGYGLSELRQMHESGQLTDEELARAKALIIGRYRPHSLRGKSGPSDAGDAPGGRRVDDA